MYLDYFIIIIIIKIQYMCKFNSCTQWVKFKNKKKQQKK